MEEPGVEKSDLAYPEILIHHTQSGYEGATDRWRTHMLQPSIEKYAQIGERTQEAKKEITN